MDVNEFIDWDERDFPETESAAVLECVNCRRVVERLQHVPEFDYMGCDDCLAEAMAVIERERREALAGSRRCAGCEKQARWNSIYCSERCKHQFLAFDEEVA